MEWKMTFTLGNLVTIATVLSAVVFIYRMVLLPMKVFVQEHDLMWEDYSKRHGMGFRIVKGRQQMGSAVRGRPRFDNKREEE